MTNEELYDLTTKFLQGALSAEEKARLEEWYRQDTQEEIEVVFPAGSAWSEEADLKAGLLQKIRQRTTDLPSTEQTTVRRIHPSRKWWAAAAILLMLSGSLYYFINTRSGTTPLSPTSQDIGPGREGAMLTLSDGTKLVLDSLGNGVVATQQNTQLMLANGRLAYKTSPPGQRKPNEGEISWNTMSTPKGRQFQLQLPDGSKAWLNAASSIRYPVAFTGKERRVMITGEVYFEIAKNARQPFIVDRDGNQETSIEVLGTSFNIHAYNNENLEATLLEGSIQVNNGTEKAVLKPRQQARISRSFAGADRSAPGMSIINDADIGKVMAWRNNLFNFEDAGIEEVMQQLARWYDIDIVYPDGIPDIHFVGKMSRNMKLSGVLKALELSKVHFKLEEGRKLIVLK